MKAATDHYSFKKINFSSLSNEWNVSASCCALWNSSYLKSVYKSQSTKKCISFSIQFLLQKLHFLSSKGIWGLAYRPVSIAKGKAPLLKFAKMRLCDLFTTVLQYNISNS